MYIVTLLTLKELCIPSLRDFKHYTVDGLWCGDGLEAEGSVLNSFAR
jgi:hypothetical protein